MVRVDGTFRKFSELPWAPSTLFCNWAALLEMSRIAADALSTVAAAILASSLPEVMSVLGVVPAPAGRAYYLPLLRDFI